MPQFQWSLTLLITLLIFAVSPPAYSHHARGSQIQMKSCQHCWYSPPQCLLVPDETEQPIQRALRDPLYHPQAE